MSVFFVFRTGHAQEAQVSDSLHFIVANVNPSTGLICVTLPPGRPNYDRQLNFLHKSFFSCQVGSDIYTNDDQAKLPLNTHLLTSGITVIVRDYFGGGTDTIRTTWPDRNGVDIIQDVWCIPFTKSGQCVLSWKFRNKNADPVGARCQFLNDIQITDPTSIPGRRNPKSNSNDGPKMLTKYHYDDLWTQLPDSFPVPWFYIAFLYDLPGAPVNDPGLSGMGYMDYGAPLDLTKPFRYTNGDWATLAYWDTIFYLGPNLGGNTLRKTDIGPDNAVLLEFSGITIASGQTLEAARTSYGTGEYETCDGQLFSLVFYPHHLVWHKELPPPPGKYIPNPIHIEKFLVNPGYPENNLTTDQTSITLKVSKDLVITDSLCKNIFGPSQTQPPPPDSGISLDPGGVAYFDWWACANPAYFCKGEVIDTLTFLATCSYCKQSFVDQLNTKGGDECQLPIIIDCAETDINPPLHPDTLIGGCDSIILHVHDNRKNDKGLASVTWLPTPKAKAGFVTNPDSIKIRGPFPPINPCYFDTLDHIFIIYKLDSALGGSYDFTFTDCIGNVSDTTIIIPACPEAAHPDTLPPVYTLIKKLGAYDSTICDNGAGDNNRIDSFSVSDIRKYDSGIGSISVTDSSNMSFYVLPFSQCSPVAYFVTKVRDSMQDGHICIRTFDCAKPNANHSDTCIRYCPLPDTIAPRISIVKDNSRAGKWSVTVCDDTAWDRHIDSIFVVNAVNIDPAFIPSPIAGKGIPCFSFTVMALDTIHPSSFCVEATDLAGNRSKPGAHCASQGVGNDSLCPNFVFNPQLTQNPTSVRVDVNDIHFINGKLYVWDSGIDSIWFTGNNGMILPNNGSTIYCHGKYDTSFTISVLDTSAIDSVSCVQINAIDIAGNMCYATYCYPYTKDTLCPVTKLWFDPSDSSIIGVVTDSTASDRGLSIVTTGPGFTNIDTVSYFPKGAKIQQVKIIRPNTKQSSVGSLTSQDLWGALALTPGEHLCTVNYAIWVQTFKMGDQNPKQNTDFTVPIYFAKTDGFPVGQKNITSLSFNITKTADSLKDINSITFTGIDIGNTEIQKLNWITSFKISGVNNEIITITLSMPPGGKPLDAPPLATNNPDSLVLLKFHAKADNSSHEVRLIGNNFLYNNGQDSIYTASCCKGINAIADMPAPFGAMDTNATIVITGECSPILLTNNAKPTSVSLDPNQPNPFSHKTIFYYTVAEDGPVKLAIFDELGKEVAQLIDQIQKQGAYSITFDASNLATGNYIARIESGGVAVSRTIRIEK